MKEMNKTSASMDGNENEDFIFPCCGFKTTSEMMGVFMKGEKGSFDCGEMMKKWCGNKKAPLDFRKMMKRMCDVTPERRTGE
jgi:hypothetical protein